MKIRWIVGAAIVVVVAWVAWAAQYWIFTCLGITWHDSADKLGQWGDSFGALNALFSAFAFIAVLVTLKQQREDLARQQQQILDGRLDQHFQQFETTFYELLRLLREARDAVEFRNSKEFEMYTVEDGSRQSTADGIYKGTEAFKRANFEMRFWINRVMADNVSITAEILAEIYTTRVHYRYESSFAPYYRLLYTHLLRIKEDLFLTEAQKHQYGNLVRSQLTSHEVALCCYDGLAPFSGTLRTLIIEFRLAKYLSNEFGRGFLESVYPEATFMGRD